MSATTPALQLAPLVGKYVAITLPNGEGGAGLVVAVRDRHDKDGNRTGGEILFDYGYGFIIPVGALMDRYVIEVWDSESLYEEFRR